MANYTNLRVYDELPPRRRSYQQVALDKRLMVVLRASRKGKWVRYAHYPTQETAVSKATKLRNRPGTKAIGRLLSEQRFDTRLKRWNLFLKFDTVNLSNRDIEENIVDAGGHAALDALETSETPAEG